MSDLGWNKACYDQLKWLRDNLLDGSGSVDIRIAGSGKLSGDYRGSGILIENIDNRVRAMIRAQVTEEMDRLKEKIAIQADALAKEMQ
jgi:hypothetical protein